MSTALLMLMVASVVFSFYGVAFVKICLKKLERIPIAIDSISSNDGWVIAVIVTYALPLASFVFEGSNLYISGALLVAAGLFLATCNNIYPNPLLVLAGYHFYKVTNIDGGGEICLLSKRDSIHNREAIQSVVCAFNYLTVEGR